MFSKHVVNCKALHEGDSDTMERFSQRLWCLCWWAGLAGCRMPGLQKEVSCSLWRLSLESGGLGMNWTFCLGHSICSPLPSKHLADRALGTLPSGLSHPHHTTGKRGSHRYPAFTLLGLCLNASLCQEHPSLSSWQGTLLLFCPHPNLYPQAGCKSSLRLPQVPGIPIRVQVTLGFTSISFQTRSF